MFDYKNKVITIITDDIIFTGKCCNQNETQLALIPIEPYSALEINIDHVLENYPDENMKTLIKDSFVKIETDIHIKTIKRIYTLYYDHN